MTSDDNINYQGVPKDYKPELGHAKDNGIARTSTKLGYHDLDRLRGLLDQVIQETKTTIIAAEEELTEFSLKVEEGTRLEEAHKNEWPATMSEPKNYVSYLEYKALGSVDTRGAQYVRKVYEENVRGPGGTNSVDIILGSSSIQKEALNIQDFLNDSIGDKAVDSSQYRTLELLQDWAESALDYARGFRTVLKARKQSPSKIPQTELDSLNQSQATEYQAIFKVKVNAINDEISKEQQDIRKNYGDMSEIYYKRFLGPSIRFREKVTSQVEETAGLDTFLDAQVRSAAGAIDANVSALLADQLNRNEMFFDKMEKLLGHIRIRDNFVGYIEQLGTKGKSVNTPFTQVDLDPEEIEGFEHFVAEVEAAKVLKNSFRSDHADLAGRDSDDAHPQYLLRSGGEITGEVTMDDDATIDGMRPSEHRHRGVDVDGTPKIRGEDIEDLVTTSIDKNEAICWPQNLRHINNQPFTGTNNVTLVNSQIAWDCDPDLTFEVQTVPVGAKPTPPLPTIDYCVTTLYETDLDIVAGLGSDFNFFTFATSTAVYNYNWTTGILTTIAGSEGSTGDAVGDSITKARFTNIVDLTQDFFDGRVYIADGIGRKIKMTGKANTSGHILPMDVSTVYNSAYNIKRVDSQGQSFLNTLYVLVGPDNAGKDRVIKLIDTDGNNLQAGTYAASEITKLSGVYSDIIDIAVTPNGFVYLLGGTTLYQYDPNADTVKTFDVSESESAAVPTAITSDQYGDIYITYSSS